MLFLGGKEGSTLKEISETLGKETIDLYNTSDTRGQSRSYGLNYQKTGKELMSRDELAVMDGNKCILQLRGVRRFFSDKFDITRHKQYNRLSDYDKKNAFDVEAYMKCQLKLRLKEEFDLFEVNVEEKRMSDIFRDMQSKLGCRYISDLRIRNGRYGMNFGRMPLAGYGEKQLEDFARYVFGG